MYLHTESGFCVRAFTAMVSYEKRLHTVLRSTIAQEAGV